MTDTELPEWVIVGATFHELDGTLWHIRGIVDGLAVCRTWFKIKQKWHYDVKTPLGLRRLVL